MDTTSGHKEGWLIDDPEIRWFAPSFGSSNQEASWAWEYQQNNEKIFGNDEAGDRRERILSGSDDRLIIQCIGQIGCQWEYNKNQKTAQWGTGTVYKYDEETNMCYVLTCAHNVLEKDPETNQVTEAQVKQFYRVETLPVGSKKSWNLMKSDNSHESDDNINDTRSDKKKHNRNFSDNDIIEQQSQTNSLPGSPRASATFSKRLSRRSLFRSQSLATFDNNININTSTTFTTKILKNNHQIQTNIDQCNFRNPFKYCNHPGKYKILEVISHPKYLYYCENQHFCCADLAIIKFEDDGFYKQLFNDKKDANKNNNKIEEIKLFACNNANDNENENENENDNANENKNEDDIKFDNDNETITNTCCYQLYGFPLKDENNAQSKVISGGLYGMKATIKQTTYTCNTMNFKHTSKQESNVVSVTGPSITGLTGPGAPRQDTNDNINIIDAQQRMLANSRTCSSIQSDYNGDNNTNDEYVRLKDKMWFYNAIDTEGGQSGSSLFIETSKQDDNNNDNNDDDEKNDNDDNDDDEDNDDGDKKNIVYISYNIVGVHAGGRKRLGKNWAVALNKDKISWINDPNDNRYAPPAITNIEENEKILAQGTQSAKVQAESNQSAQSPAPTQNCWFKCLCCRCCCC